MMYNLLGIQYQYCLHADIDDEVKNCRLYSLFHCKTSTCSFVQTTMIWQKVCAQYM